MTENRCPSTVPRKDGVRRFVAIFAAAALVTASVSVAVLTHVGGAWVHSAISDLAYLVFVAAASASAAWAAKRSSGRVRWSWLALAIGLGAATVGEALWSYYEVVLGHSNPFPSLADVGFLCQPLGAAMALALFPSHDGAGARRRHLLDGLMVGTALMLISWSTALGAVVHGGGATFAFAVALAYPVGDLVVLTMVVLTLGRVTVHRHRLALMGMGMALIAAGDSGYTYLNSTGQGSATDLLNVAWLTGFTLLALAPLAPTSSGGRETDRRASGWPASGLFWPYVPLVLAAVVLAVRRLTGYPVDGVTQALVALMVGLILLRQFATLRDNRSLVATVAAGEGELRYQARHDTLTGLPNRALILDRVEQALARARRHGSAIAVLFLDLDGFKEVNDTFGHATGDELLRVTAARLTTALRESDTVGRLGGDEFIVLLEGRSLSDGAEAVAAKIREALREPFHLTGARELNLHVNASIGIAVGLRPSPDELLRDADVAMYEAKNAGKDCAVVFVPEMQTAVHDHLELEMDLRDDIGMSQFHLLYQPTFDIETMAITGVEALLRWQHPTRGLLLPDEFIPLMEETGLVVAAGRWVLGEACLHAGKWQRRGHPLSVAVKVSGRQLDTDGVLRADVVHALERSGLDPSLLTLEITESVLMRDTVASARRLRSLKELGLQIAIDDFGTGSSSLAYLQKFPIDSLKIDRSFVSRMSESPDSGALIHTIVQLGKLLGIETYAEGIEDPTQLDGLQREDCSKGQGYLFPRPLSADAVEELIAGSLVTTSAGTAFEMSWPRSA